VDLFAELVSFPRLALAPNFTLELALIQEEEVRVARHLLMSGYGCGALSRSASLCSALGITRAHQPKRWRRHGWETVERRLLQVLARRTFRGPDAFAALLPPDLPATFTTADLAAGLKAPLWLAQKMAYCLREMGALGLVGKAGRSCLYARGEGLPSRQ
jgi:hypothetical protein